MHKGLLVITILAVLAIALIESRHSSGVDAYTTTHSSPASMLPGLDIESRVYVGGNMVAEDPPARPFYLIIGGLMAGHSSPTTINISGLYTSFNTLFGVGHTRYIVVGDGAADPATTYKLGHQVATGTNCFTTVDKGVLPTTNIDYYNITFSCYISYTGNITEAGLVVDDVLLFYASFPPVHVDGNITVSFNIYVKTIMPDQRLDGLALWLENILLDDNGWRDWIGCLTNYVPSDTVGIEPVSVSANPYWGLDQLSWAQTNYCGGGGPRTGIIVGGPKGDTAYVADAVIGGGNQGTYNSLCLYYYEGGKFKVYSSYGGYSIQWWHGTIRLFCLPVNVEWSGAADRLFLHIWLRWGG